MYQEKYFIIRFKRYEEQASEGWVTQRKLMSAREYVHLENRVDVTDKVIVREAILSEIVEHLSRQYISKNVVT